MKKILFCIMLFLSSINYGLEQPYSDYNFTGGLNLRDYPDLIRPDQCQDAENILYDEKLGLVKRKSYNFICSMPVNPTTKFMGGVVFKKDDGSKYYVVQVGSTVFSTSDINTPTWTVVRTGLSTIYPVVYAVHFNKLWMTNGVNTVFVWTGTAESEYSFVPKGQLIISAKGRIWIGATIDNPNYVYISEINNDPITSDDWDIVNNAFQIGLGTGQIIKAIREMQNIIFVFLEKSIYGILGNAETSLDDFTVKNYSNDYGCLSNNSIYEFDNGLNFLDKTGLYNFNTSVFVPISENIKPHIDKLGLLNINNKRWSNTTTADFAPGTFLNCFANGDTITLSTMSKTWSTNADFSPAAAGSTHYIIQNNNVSISTASGNGYTKIPLKFYRKTGDLLMTLHGGDITSLTDADDNTFDAPVVSGKNSFQWFSLANSNNDTTPLHIKRLRIKIQNGIYTFSRLWYGNPDWWTSANINTFQIDTYNSAQDPETRNTFIFPNYSKSSVDQQDLIYEIPDSIYIYDINKSSPTRIQIGFNSAIQSQPFQGEGASLAPLIFDISAYSFSSSLNFSSATYFSPPFDSGQATTQFQTLKTVHNIGLDVSSGTIKYWARTAATSGALTSATSYYLGLSSGSSNTFNIPSGCDNNEWFQYIAEIWTSSTIYTPSINEVTLQYATTGYGTYQSIVKNVGNKITTWGSFVADTEGTVTFQISSNTVNWVNIVSGDNIPFPITSQNISYKCFLNSKNAKVNSVNITWFENFGSGGGSQDVSSTNIYNRYYLAVSTWTSYNDKIYIFDKNKAWARYGSIPVQSFLKDDNICYVLSSTQSVILQMDVDGGSEGTNYKAFWTSGDLFFNNIDRQKWMRYAFLTSPKNTGSFINFVWSINKSTNTTTKTIDFSSNSNMPMEFGSEIIGKFFTFTLQSTGTFSNNGMMKGFNIYYELKDLNPLIP